MDNEHQRKLALKSLFESQGYKLFISELNEFHLGTIDEQNMLARGPHDSATLNFCNGRNNGVMCVLNILDGLREELEDVSAEGR